MNGNAVTFMYKMVNKQLWKLTTVAVDATMCDTCTVNSYGIFIMPNKNYGKVMTNI